MLRAMAEWAGIVRVSHMGARREGAQDFHADRDQIALINRAVPKGDRVHILAPELNVSGGLPLEERPALLAAVEGVERGRYAGIIVAYLSRLGRNLKEQLRVYDRVHAAGGQIIVAQEGIDARTRGGRLQRNILAAIHEDEREAHVERFEDLRREATAAGVWQRRQTPLGYSRDPGTRRLAPNRDANRVRAAFAARANGDSVSSIARTLGMTTSGTRHLLRNRVYLGELRVGDHINPSAHPALITEDTWVAAQIPRTVRPALRDREVALLAGLARCCGCGHLMSRMNTSNVVYACHRDHSAGRCAAPAAITARLVDEYVERVAVAQLARLTTRAVRDDGAVERARSAVASAERELAAYVEAVSAADIGAEAFRVGAQARQRAVDDARAGLEATVAARVPSVPADIADRYRGMSVTHRNRLLRSLVETVLVARSGRGRVVPVEARVRVIVAGAGIAGGRHHGGGAPLPLRVIELPDGDDPRVLGV